MYTCIYYEKAMPVEFCDYLLKSVDWSVSKPGDIHKEPDRIYTNYRSVNIVSEHLMSPLGSICKNYLVDGNSKGKWAESICDFDIPQILKYEVNDHYWWHNDVLPPRNGMERKVSLCMLLNDPSEFEGGNLEIKDKTENALKNKGDIIIFDSTARHRVSPVTSGKRFSVVSWAYGFCKD